MRSRCFYCLLLPAFVEMFVNHSLLPAKPKCFDFTVIREGDSDEHLALLFGSETVKQTKTFLVQVTPS